MKTLNTLLLSTCLITFACNNKEIQQDNSSNTERKQLTNPLSSWNDGTAKNNIIDFVEAATDSSSEDFIPVKDRIAVFDNDGTLWSEQPMYFQLFFAIDRVKTMAADHPEWKNTQPFKAVLENDMEALKASGVKGIVELTMTTHSGMNTQEFEEIVSQWINTKKHPRFNVLFKELAFQPMLELLDYLRAHNFKTFIVSGGGIEFMRPWVEEVYGIPKHHVVGSSIKTSFQIIDGKPQVMRFPEIDFIDDKEGKPVGINKHIGRMPVFCAGNSDGDLQMMQWTASGKGKRMMLYVHHTDSLREWAYDRNSHIGQFDKGLDEATEKGWTIIDMKKDWKVIYPFELEK